MPIPIPNNKPSGGSGRGVNNAPDNARNRPPQRPSRQLPKINKPERVSNPYDSPEEEVFSTDSNYYSEPYEDASVPRPVKNPFANNDNYSEKNNSNDDDYANFEDLEQDNNDNHYNSDDDSDYDNNFEEEFEEYDDEDFDDEATIEEKEKERFRRLAYEYYDEDQEEVEKSAKRRKAKKPRKSKNRKDNTGQDVFVDDKNLKLEPYGKKNRKLKVSEFDKRENKQKKATIVRIVIIAGVVVLVGLGLKNAIIPPETLNENEVAQISMQTVGMTNFPEERGKSFVEDFMTAYLTLSPSSKESEALSYFYTGVVKDNLGLSRNNSNAGVSPSGANFSSNGYYEQEIIIGPNVTHSLNIDDNSASYTVGALVQPNAPITTNENEEPPKLDGNHARWVFFNVNVFYNQETDTMYISNDSPTLVPNESVGPARDVPKALPLGNGTKAEDSVIPEIRPVINGYIAGYADSSNTDYSRVEQYLSNDAADTAKSGLSGEFKLAGSPENSISFVPYLVSGDPNQLKVDVTVDWISPITQENSTEIISSITYTSKYVATLVKASDGKWEVQNFDAVKYVADPEELANINGDEQ